MQIELESSLARWVEAELLDPGQALRIREYESVQAPRSRARIPILIGLAFGGLMLAAGVLLFISAHWDRMSPAQRMTLVVSAIAAFHIAAACCADKFRAMATTLHAVGTIALGGGIFLAGQIFHMQSHWPMAVLMWACGAIAGWILLREWPQLALSAILIPFWITGEWTEAAGHTRGASEIAAVGCLLLSMTYLSIRGARPDDAISRSFAWIGSLALFPSVFAVAEIHRHYGEVPPGLEPVGWAGAILLPLALAFYYRRTSAWMNAAAAFWVVILSLLSTAPHGADFFAWLAVGAAGMIAWGVAESRIERINLGMAGFALTLLCFYFSSVMDRLGRSASLITLGILFLAGGWYGEKLRRTLVARAIQEGVR